MIIPRLPSVVVNQLRRKATAAGPRVASSLFSSTSAASTTSTEEFTDRCNLNIVTSPFPPIEAGPYPPFYEFLTQNWKPHGGYLYEEVAIVDGAAGLERTYRDYHETSGGFAGTLRHEMGIDEHATVALYCPNHVDYLPVCLAVSLCGAKMTPVNPLYKQDELEVVLERSRSSVLITHTKVLDVALKAAKNSKYVKQVVVITDHGESIPEGTVALDSVRQHDKAFHETVHAVHKDTSAHPFLLPYSSGTTGLPKGVCLSHSNLVANLLQFKEIEALAFPPGGKLLSPLPFFHIYAWTVSLMAAAWMGNPLITMSGQFDLETFCKLIEEHKPQRAHLVPPILLALAKHPLIDKYDLSSLQMVISAAAPLSSDTETAVRDRLGVEVKQAWGMSELSPIGTLQTDFNAKSGSVGPVVSSTVAKIVDEHGNSLGPNEPGELMLKGPQVMMGYLDDPDKTAECLSTSGWLRTGDMALYDKEGYFYITDRIKELIKVRGYPVAPAELEALLITHEAVSDAAVVQVPDDDSGELPRAYVVTKDNEEAKKVSDEDLYAWVKERVAPYKRLNGGIVFTDVIPKSASGKILRRILRDRVKAEMAQ